jgi:hypothetical protein
MEAALAKQTGSALIELDTVLVWVPLLKNVQPRVRLLIQADGLRL